MGNQLLATADLRRRFDLYLTADERHQLEIKAKAARLPMSIFLRRVALAKKLTQPPSEISRAQYADLARVGANLNQIAAAINAGRASGIDVVVINDLAEQVRLLRMQLIGATGEADTASGEAT